MRITRLRLENWRNFRSVDVALERRVFIVGPNASGKSNLLDALRFVRDLAEPQGGLVRAVEAPSRRGMSQLRSLYARQQPNVLIEVSADLEDDGPEWTYRLELGQDNRRRPLVKGEVVKHGQKVLLSRPGKDDESDPSLLHQTHLEQVSANRRFRQLADSLAKIHYLHLVPQLVREPERSVGRSEDPFGGDFLEQVASTPAKTRDARLKKICDALRVAVPQLAELRLERDARGVPHLQGLHEHWRPNAGWQSEEHLSDGTLRLLGLLWAFLEGTEPLLLEEPELSLHSSIVRALPQMIWRLGRRRRQVLLSTHAHELLSDPGISGNEVLALMPGKEGTRVIRALDDPSMKALLDSGLAVGDVVLERTRPSDAEQLALFGS